MAEHAAETRDPDRQEGGPSESFDQLRPWYEEPGVPNLFDIHWGIREELATTGITPKVGLNATSEKFDQTGSPAQLRRD